MTNSKISGLALVAAIVCVSYGCATSNTYARANNFDEAMRFYLGCVLVGVAQKNTDATSPKERSLLVRDIETSIDKCEDYGKQAAMQLLNEKRYVTSQNASAHSIATSYVMQILRRQAKDFVINQF